MKKRILSFALALMATSSLMISQANGKMLNKRIYGANRYNTAIKISDEWNKSKYAVVVRGDDFADAVCAVPLSKKYDAPIFLTKSNKIDTNVLKKLKQLEVSNVYIIGGNGAVSKEVENDISKICKVERIYGKDRYETSQKIADKLGKYNEVAIVEGNSYADAASISSVAAIKKMPIILINNSVKNMPNNVENNIKTYIIGGEKIISKDMEKYLPNVERIYGKDRYETNFKIIKRFEKELSFNKMYIATGRDFPDAITGGALAAKNNSPMVLVNKNINKDTNKIISSNIVSDSEIILLGGNKVVADSVVNTIKGDEDNKGNKVYKGNGYIMKVNGEQVELEVSNVKNNCTLLIYDDEDNIKYIDEENNSVDNKVIFKFNLNPGKYKGKVNGKSITEFKIIEK